MLSFLGDLLLAPFKCFLATQSDDESVPMPNTSPEPIDDDDETTNKIDVRRDSAAEDCGWPPKKHKEPFVAQMSQYWDQRVLDELQQAQIGSQAIITKTTPAAPVIYCRNSIEV